MEITDRN